MVQTVSAYQYIPLPSENFIRLLEVEPGHMNDSVNCTLRQFEFENVPSYEAISYAWGDPANRVDVLCDGKVITVTQNLKDALVRFKLKDKTRMLWADAICINQEDDVEKGSQVKLMNRIYMKAARVCAWLGGSSAQMQPAFELITQIVTYASLKNTHKSYNSMVRNELPSPASQCWPALEIFFSAPWFRRLWIIQEVYGHTCSVFCGEHELDWGDIVLVARFLLQLNQSNRSSAYPLPHNAFAVLQINSAGHQRSTSGIFDTFRQFHCSDERDKVYALLSFPPLCDLQPPIKPDYRMPVAEVFEDATVRIFLLQQSLGLLSSLEHGCTVDEEWPSWVPRWDRPRTTQILHNYTSGRVHSSLFVIKHKPKILISKGVKISAVIWCGVTVDETLPEESGVDPLKKPFEEWLLKYHPRISNPNDPLLLYIAMSLTVGLDLGSNCPPLDLSQYRLDFLAYVVSVLQTLHSFDTTKHVLEELTEQALAGNPSNFQVAAIRGSKNKRFFQTQHGALGVGPRAMRADDDVVLLSGSNAPCVLRRRGSYYQFVGECYLHQHMHGEAIGTATRGLSAVEEFEIR